MRMKPLYIIALAIFFTSCNNSKKEKSNSTGDKEMVGEDVDAPVEEGANAKKVTDRDFSVTVENAYNDMFLDSLAMERYISK